MTIRKFWLGILTFNLIGCTLGAANAGVDNNWSYFLIYLFVIIFTTGALLLWWCDKT